MNMNKRQKILDAKDMFTMELTSVLCGAPIANGPVLNIQYAAEMVSGVQFDTEHMNDANDPVVGMVRPSLHQDTSDDSAPIVHLYLEKLFFTTSPGKEHTYVALHNDAEKRTFFAKPAYSLNDVLPSKTLVHAFCYFDKDHAVTLSFFDCSVLAGENLRSLHPIERFRKLHAALRPRKLIGHHWIGEMETAVQQYRLKTAPFNIHSLMRVPSVL